MRFLSPLVALLLLGSAVPFAVHARAPNQRGIDTVAVDATPARVSRLAGLTPAGHWVLIVLDAHRFSSRKYTDALKTSGYEGKNAIVLVIGDAASAKAVAKRRHLLPDAQWLTARASASLKALALVGTPAALGMDADQIIWQVSGLPAHAGNLAVQLADWTGATSRRVSP